MSNVVEQRLIAQGMVLPEATRPPKPLQAAVRHGDIAWVSGQLPRRDGAIVATGRLGEDVDLAAGCAAAELAALNALAILRDTFGDLDQVVSVLSLRVYVSCTSDFTEQPAVADAASHVIATAFGTLGGHTRTAIGVTALPRRAPVEVEVVAALRPEGAC